MTDPKIKELKAKINQRHTENFKKMWHYANWEWRIVLIIGMLNVIYWMFKLGMYVAS